MKTTHFAVITLSFSFASLAFAQEATPVPTATPIFSGGTITGDAANGGPVGGVSAVDNNSSGFNSGEGSGGSTSTPVPTPTPTPTPPHHKPHHTPTPAPTP